MLAGQLVKKDLTMNNIEKKLDALIDALGFDVKEEYIPLDDFAISDWHNKHKANRPVTPKPEPTINYKLTKRKSSAETNYLNIPNANMLTDDCIAEILNPNKTVGGMIKLRYKD